jgi:hypothetical protein
MLGLAGCASEEPMPQVVYESPATVAPKITPSLPTPTRPVPSTPILVGPVPTAWVPSRPERAWSAIVIHHSATGEGNAAIFDKWHREENGWNGVGYDFVIGNGTDSPDGAVEPTYRWRGQLTGAHAGGTPGNWANEEGIGICLVGDFNRTAPTARQMDSLVRLVRFLQQRYGIPRSRVYGHGSVPGGHVTDCPGRRFPMSWLKSNL